MSEIDDFLELHRSDAAVRRAHAVYRTTLDVMRRGERELATLRVYGQTLVKAHECEASRVRSYEQFALRQLRVIAERSSAAEPAATQ